MKSAHPHRPVETLETGICPRPHHSPIQLITQAVTAYHKRSSPDLLGKLMLIVDVLPLMTLRAGYEQGRTNLGSGSATLPLLDIEILIGSRAHSRFDFSAEQLSHFQLDPYS